eukprot:GFUD01038077.1.p1 GENE.GFUD01038077.1~~GFUD01038077.1.p1  ORF type:complete len:636 (+),score=147.35 GFUD01038077.1:90-1997(+)
MDTLENSDKQPLVLSMDYGTISEQKPPAITFSWNNITVRQPRPQSRASADVQTDHIVVAAAGEASPGDLLAILGSSGAGKTSLLNALTFRNLAGLEVTGNRMVNQELATPSGMTSVSAYVQQDDLFIGTLTVREHLVFQAMVRMDQHLGYKARVARVEEVIADLGLDKCKNTQIGVPGTNKGISGGERKRLSFATEILTNPSILFCDEPTSGLDSYMAGHVVELMKELANQGRTVVTTIHQPSSIILAQFNKILLIAEGRTAYMGEISGATNFLSSCGYPCPPQYNPADHAIEVLTILPTDKENSRQRVAKICNQFSQTSYGQLLAFQTPLEQHIKPAQTNPHSPYAVGWCPQFWALLWRGWLSVIREPKIMKVRVFQTVFIAGLIGVIYYGQNADQAGIVNINGVLFFFITNLTFSNIFNVINVFCMELPVFLREHHSGRYRTDVYFLTKQLAEMPIFVLLPLLLLGITYFLIQLNPLLERFVIACGVLELLTQTVISYGYFVSCLCSSLPLALGVASPLILPLFIFGGMFLKNGSLPFWLEWMKYLSWFYYSYEALVINQWSGVTNISCSDVITTTSNNTGTERCLRTGLEVLEQLNFQEENFYFDILMLTVLSVGLRVAAFLTLLAKTRRKT